MKHLPKIQIEVIPHSEQKYPTCGDYFFQKEFGRSSDEILNLRVSSMNEVYEFLIAEHEFIEWFLIYKKGIKIKDIDKFDIAYEKAREKHIKAPCGCKPTKISEPGDDKHAPYYSEHQFATKLEKLLAKKLKVNWNIYSKVVESL